MTSSRYSNNNRQINPDSLSLTSGLVQYPCRVTRGNITALTPRFISYSAVSNHFFFPGRLAELELLCLTLTRPRLVNRLIYATGEATYFALSHAWYEGCKAVCSFTGRVMAKPVLILKSQV